MCVYMDGPYIPYFSLFLVSYFYQQYVEVFFSFGSCRIQQMCLLTLVG